MANLGVYICIVGITWSVLTITKVLLHVMDRGHRWF